MSDFTTGAFTADFDPTRMITIHHPWLQVGDSTYPNVEIGDLLAVPCQPTGQA